MTQFIQKFIEKNIELIEDNKWDEVFLNWYNDAEEIWPDDADEFKHFLDILLKAGIEPNMFSRYHVLYDEIVWMLENAKKGVVIDYTTNDGLHVGRFTMINNLNSLLGYTAEEVHKIMDDAASSLNMRYTEYFGGGYTW
jgi:hypothetical protein